MDCGKRRKCWLPAFSPLPTCFQKASFLRSLKVRIMWLRVDLVSVKCLANKKKLDSSNFNPFPNKPWFLRVCSISLLKTLLEKEKLLETSNFSFSHSVFSPFRQLSAIFIKFEIVVCKHFQFGRV